MAERLNGPPEDNPWQKWFLGVATPAAAIVYAGRLFSQNGLSAGVAFLICVGLFAHVHYFWYQSPRLDPYAELAKNVLAAPLLALIGYVLYVFVINFV